MDDPICINCGLPILEGEESLNGRREAHKWERGCKELAAARAEVAEAKDQLSICADYARELNEDAEQVSIQRDNLQSQLAAAQAEIVELKGTLYAHAIDPCLGCQIRDEQIDAAREREDRIMIGGNHLASALIGMFGEPPPNYHLAPGAARIECGTQDIYDAWVCWRTIMLIRDERDAIAAAHPEPGADVDEADRGKS